jgi:hypothetical protein
LAGRLKLGADGGADGRAGGASGGYTEGGPCAPSLTAAARWGHLRPDRRLAALGPALVAAWLAVI